MQIVRIEDECKVAGAHFYKMLLFCAIAGIAMDAAAQEIAIPDLAPTAAPAQAEQQVTVGVRDVARDEQIQSRLLSILQSTQWFEQPQLSVRNGVVFLGGETDEAEHKEWAGRLAQRTEDVVAVVNKIEVVERPVWDISPAVGELQVFWRQVVQLLPLLAFGLLLVILAYLAARGFARVAVHALNKRVTNNLLLEVLRKIIFIAFLLVGVFLMLRVTGLSRLALTLAGGTGIAGLVIGIALRDIAENFLASLLISIQRPFLTGDLIHVNEQLGFVQKVTMRGTVLMDFDGNHIQIPNATIYKSMIRNYTANPNQRLEFRIGIGYEVPISQAQEVGLRVLRDHPAVLDDPEPMVLVEEFAASTVNLRIYFWVNNHTHSVLRVKSSVMRLTVRAFQEASISLPDEAREIIFPAGVPVHMVEESPAAPAGGKAEEGSGAAATPPSPKAPIDTGAVSTAAEGSLTSEAGEIRSQASKSRLPEEGRNLLDAD